MRKPVLLLSLVILILSLPAQAQRKASFDPDGSFWIIGDHGDGFSDFGGINLNAKRLRRLPSAGVQLVNGKMFRFKTLNVKRDNFTFTTVSIAGVSYSFSGKFLMGGVFAATDLSDERPVLEGVLRKHKAGKKVAEAKLKFMYFGGT
jgi:hypothetical protein